MFHSMSESCWLPELEAVNMPETKALPSHGYTVAAWPPQEQKSGGSNGNGHNISTCTTTNTSIGLSWGNDFPVVRREEHSKQ